MRLERAPVWGMEQKWELTKKLNKEGKNLVNKRREKKVTGGSVSSVFLEIVNTCNHNWNQTMYLCTSWELKFREKKM